MNTKKYQWNKEIILKRLGILSCEFQTALNCRKKPKKPCAYHLKKKKKKLPMPISTLVTDFKCLERKYTKPYL